MGRRLSGLVLGAAAGLAASVIPATSAGAATTFGADLSHAPSNRAGSGTTEPDGDGDGFGDLSQDSCVGAAGPYRGCPNTVSIDRLTQVRKRSKVRLLVTTPGAGTLDVGPPSDHAGTVVRPVLRSATQALTSTTRQQAFVTLKLTKLGSRLLAAKGRLKVAVEVDYTPPDGPAGTQTSQIKLVGMTAA